jgi:hypothetical protein
MEFMRIKKGVASLALAGTLFGGTVLGVGAERPQQANNGAAGVVAAAVQALNNIDIRDNVVDVAVVELNDSLNNLTLTALNDLTALNNFLNGSPILSNNDVTIQDVDVLSPTQIAILEAANINIDDVVGVAILSGGDLLVFTR